MIFNVYALLAAFGGGVLGAAIGALPAFIMTGVLAAVGAICQMTGINEYAVNSLAFGSMFGPHIAFAGGVAAAAYAKKIGKLENGADICTAGFGLGAPSVLLVGGIFGIFGYGLKVGLNFVFGGTISPKLVTDLPGLIVFISGLLARWAFSEKGLLSPCEGKRKVLSSGKALGNTLLVGFGYSIVVAGSFVAIVTQNPVLVEDISAIYPVMIFGIAAIGLIFAEFGQAYFGWHHIGLISASTVVTAYGATANGWLALIFGVLFGVIAALLCDLETNLINTDCDSHIDGPAFAIFVMTFVINAIWG